MEIRRIFLATVATVAALQMTGCADAMWGRNNGGASGTPTNTSQGGVPPGAVVLSGSCDAAAGAYAIGWPATAAMQSELITKTLAKTLRVIRPGEYVTQEFSSQRLNLQTDGTGRITAVTCG
ncbi:I78 family peptidase inhibitor [Xylophilus sp. GOD-11R]|uniref:I78 family peptidase inhibitor n=1 Tax=Xylophilus sp. GOD-11R TaxID=3089814 RepID=UPI00298D31AE|nr:I78 family peptidase inhibitor [Xylophilus sp. GOD-11R]WPB57395.1 I78 family peptidase inhibitor [Xylophilus sp. GOD-11R]